MKLQLTCLALTWLVVLATVQSSQAKPYYYFFQDAPEPNAPEPGAAEVPSASALKEAAEKAGQQVANAVRSDGGSSSQGIRGHLSDLYSHGSNAMRGVVDTVQPDFKNIGKDLSDAYEATRSQVGKTIEPLAQTVRPYIDQASKMVAPYVSQAREEVPKLINQAGPTLHKVSEQVRGKLTGVIDKLKPSNGAPGEQQAQQAQQQAQQLASTGQEYAQSAASSIQRAGQQVQGAAQSAQASLSDAAQQAKQHVASS